MSRQNGVEIRHTTTPEPLDTTDNGLPSSPSASARLGTHPISRPSHTVTPKGMRQARAPSAGARPLFPARSQNLQQHGARSLSSRAGVLSDGSH